MYTINPVWWNTFGWNTYDQQQANDIIVLSCNCSATVWLFLHRGSAGVYWHWTLFLAISPCIRLILTFPHRKWKSICFLSPPIYPHILSPSPSSLFISTHAFCHIFHTETDTTSHRPTLIMQHQKVSHTLAVFEINPYSLTHYSLYSVYDIVNYIGNDQTRIQTLLWTFLNVICVNICAHIALW